MPYIEVRHSHYFDPTDFVKQCTAAELVELKAVIEARELALEPNTPVDLTWHEAMSKLTASRHQLSLEEEQTVLKIAKHIV